MTEAKRVLASHYFERFYDRTTAESAAAAVAELLSPDFVDHSPLFGLPGTRDGFRQAVILINSAFEQRYRVTDLFTDGDILVARWTAEARHRGPFLGIQATGRRVSVSGITIYRLLKQAIVEHWEQFDQFGLLTQLGAVTLSDRLDERSEALPEKTH